ncbi:MAG TPA: flagellar type III secretion system pore protein FliP [Lachnospiraceae bacterium]|nr:flagellar type III secretion system pore protein FliP [Lachnospiraceae bacterium]
MKMKHLPLLNYIFKSICLLFLVGILFMVPSLTVHATDADNDGDTDERTYEEEPGSAESSSENAALNIGNTVTVSLNNGNGTINGALQILLILTAISLIPILLIMLTSFTRIIIVLHFTRTALNTQTVPPNMVLIGLALFLTIYIMSPIFLQVYNEAIVPLDQGELTVQEAYEAGIEPLREYMAKQTQIKDVSVFMEIAGYTEWDGTTDSVPTSVLIPSYIISEMRTAFIIGFIIYIPFLIIDMVVASVLMSMGMMMLPPTTISMPFKILLFVLADGWNLIIVNLVKTFY